MALKSALSLWYRLICIRSSSRALGYCLVKSLLLRRDSLLKFVYVVSQFLAPFRSGATPPPPPKKNPASAPVSNELFSSLFLCFSEENELDSSDLSNKRSSQAHQDDHNKKRSGIIVPSKGRQVKEIRLNQ